jgi:hypothetical protein
MKLEPSGTTAGLLSHVSASISLTANTTLVRADIECSHQR